MEIYGKLTLAYSHWFDFVTSVYMNYLHQPPLPNQETLEENRRKRIRNHQIVKILYQSILFSGVLYIVITISLESRDPKSYYFKSHVEDMMAFDTVSFHWKHSTISNSSFFEWFNQRLCCFSTRKINTYLREYLYNLDSLVKGICKGGNCKNVLPPISVGVNS